MHYSQKYTLVQFFQKIDEDASFAMNEWPLHITLADVFAVEHSESLMRDLQAYIDSHPSANTRIISDGMLGDSHVWFLAATPELLAVHRAIIHILNKHGALFNNQAFINDGYLPHITKQPDTEMNIGDKVLVNVFSLVDMFPGGDWKQRKVIKHFKPSSS